MHWETQDKIKELARLAQEKVEAAQSVYEKGEEQAQKKIQYLSQGIERSKALQQSIATVTTTNSAVAAHTSVPPQQAKHMKPTERLIRDDDNAILNFNINHIDHAIEESNQEVSKSAIPTTQVAATVAEQLKITNITDQARDEDADQMTGFNDDEDFDGAFERAPSRKRPRVSDSEDSIGDFIDDSSDNYSASSEDIDRTLEKDQEESNIDESESDDNEAQSRRRTIYTEKKASLSNTIGTKTRKRLRLSSPADATVARGSTNDNHAPADILAKLNTSK